MSVASDVSLHLRGTDPELLAWLVGEWTGFEDPSPEDWKQNHNHVLDVLLDGVRRDDGSFAPDAVDACRARLEEGAAAYRAWQLAQKRARDAAKAAVREQLPRQSIPPLDDAPAWHQELARHRERSRLVRLWPFERYLRDALGVCWVTEYGGRLPRRLDLKAYPPLADAAERKGATHVAEAIRFLGGWVIEDRASHGHQPAVQRLGDWGALDHARSLLAGDDEVLGPIRAERMQDVDAMTAAWLIPEVRKLSALEPEPLPFVERGKARVITTHPLLVKGETLHPVTREDPPLAILHLPGKALAACPVVRVHRYDLELVARDSRDLPLWVHERTPLPEEVLPRRRPDPKKDPLDRLGRSVRLARSHRPEALRGWLASASPEDAVSVLRSVVDELGASSPPDVLRAAAGMGDDELAAKATALLA